MKRIFVLLMAFFAVGLQAGELQFYELKHRSAEEMIPLLRPMLPPGSGLSASGYTLLIRTDKQAQLQLAELIEKLDTPAQQLLISVHQGHQTERSAEGGDVEGELTQPKTRIYSTRRQQLHSQDQQLRVREGSWATIRSGVAVPQVVQRSQQGPAGSRVEPSIEYRDVESGFEVRPRVSGERLTLEIRPFLARPSPSGGGVIEQQELITTVSGQLGEWIELGGVLETQRGSGHGTVYATRERDRQQRNVSVKIEAIP